VHTLYCVKTHVAEKRRRHARVIWIAGAFVVLTMGLTLAAVSKRHNSKFDDLYALNPTVGQYTPTASSFGTISPLSGLRGSFSATAIRSGGSGLLFGYPHPPSPAPTVETVLVFQANDKQKVFDALKKYSGGTMMTLYVESAGARDLLSSYSDGKETITLMTGTLADDVLKQAHLTMPPDGVVVSLTEPPDWFSVRLNAVLHFLHLR
jgi:hypothetical protein